MAGIFHKGVRYSGFGNLWGMIKGNIASQTDLKEALDSKTEKNRYIVRQVTASAGTQIYIPASGTDSRIKTTGCEIKVVSQKKSDGTPYKFKSLQIYDGYAIITLGEALSGVYMGVKVTENGYNVNDLVPMEFEESITKITTATTPKITLATGVSEEGTAGTNVYAVKSGKVVYLKLRVLKTLSLNTWNDIATLPSGWYNTEANTDVSAGDFSSDVWTEARIFSNGYVKVYPKSPSSSSSNSAISITFTYILTT